MKPNFEIHIRRRHQFPCTDDNGVLTETFAICDEIWLSDFPSKDHYSWDHEYNKGVCSSCCSPAQYPAI